MKNQIKKFLDGLMFGVGFSIAFCVVAFFLLNYISFRESQEFIPIEGNDFEMNKRSSQGMVSDNFMDLPLSERVKASSVILLTKYRESTDGIYEAIITEILKMDDGVSFSFVVGDEYPRATRIPRKDGVRYGIGTIVFLEGTSANMKLSTSYFTEDDPSISAIRRILSGI